MKTLLFVLALTLPVLSAEAININKGNWEVQGALDLTHTSRYHYSYGDRTYFSISGGAQYFLADHFSTGLDVSFATAGRRSGVGSIGPAATYYFLTQERLAPYIYLSPVRWIKREGVTSQFSSTARAGVKFFLNDSIAFGPALQYERTWPRYGWGDSDSISLLGMFSIHL